MKNKTHFLSVGDNIIVCPSCKGTGKKRLTGPSFSSAIIIMDRRGL